MQRESLVDWAETSTPKIFKRSRLHTPITKTNIGEKNFYNTLYRSQHVYKQMQDNKISELHFGIIRAPIGTSVPQNEDQNLEQIGHCIVRVLIQPNPQ